ncbi:glycosyltransferase family 2 protein [Olleya sp. YS]|uniref:glycosyltransferase family 2 protein n=1 Tax=Olleya sp. YS TaxID=3028318 RepID=UPI0024341673|nr:glycosyltransferase family 2 protein [Olleya sp. YS]WGD35138.1 glycosyltransferase family 2 protein [Olleya sp. YS]
MSCFFSVVIPLYNKEKYILNTLTSVLNQTFQDFEIIIIDDGSTDDSVEIIETIVDHRITLIKQPNQGASIARNNAIKASKSQYIATLDADDIWENNHLQALKACIESIENAVLYCTNYKIKRLGGLITPAAFNFDYQDHCLIIQDFFKANTINFIPTSSSVAFKKEDFLKLNGYNTNLRTGQDIDLWIKFGLLGKVAFNPKITMTYNLYDTLSLSNSTFNDDRYLLINNYKTEEYDNPSLKHYLDINRYALAIRYKLNNDEYNFKKIKGEIDYSNLNSKQKLLLKLPKTVLNILKNIQHFLIKNNIYLSAFK